VAATTCRYLYWQRASLEYLFVKETYLATVLTTLIARDITTKLYAMNKKVKNHCTRNLYDPVEVSIDISKRNILHRKV
jgi:hypothetical protein